LFRRVFFGLASEAEGDLQKFTSFYFRSRASAGNAFDDYSITAGRATTGTNPASARSAAERTVKVFETIAIEIN
jgi:hypothetical protein